MYVSHPPPVGRMTNELFPTREIPKLISSGLWRPQGNKGLQTR